MTIGLVVAGFACGLLAERLAHRAAAKREQQRRAMIDRVIARVERRDA
jgi:hypothetical protein